MGTLAAAAVDWSTVILSEQEIRANLPFLRELSRNAHPLLDPEFFLASVDSSCWKAYAVAINRGNVPIGVIYAKERTVAGMRSGLIYADGRFGGMVAAQEDEDMVLEAGLKCLLSHRGIRGLRLAVLPGRFESDVFRRVASSLGLELGMGRSQTQNHARLSLAETYDEFLKGLGYRTRRNFRYYRRRSEEAGNSYTETLTMREFRDAAHELAPRCSLSSDPRQLTRALNMVEAVRRPVMAGIKDPSGRWLSVAGGLHHAGSAILLIQLNRDREHPNDSLSTVMRAYLIESLIGREIRELIFWGGTAGPLARYAEGVPRTQVYLDVPGVCWRAARKLIGSAARKLPGRIAAIADWMAPATSEPQP